MRQRNRLHLPLQKGAAVGLVKSAIRPRVRLIMRHPNFWFSWGIFGALWISLSVLQLPAVAPSITVLEAVGPILTFTAMGFAVSITALALILALPLNPATALMMANSRSGDAVQISETQGVLIASAPQTGLPIVSIPIEAPDSAYLDLVFVFIWTAISNVVASVVCLVAAAAVGNDRLASSDNGYSDLIVALMAGGLTYATLQMFSALKTIFEVAELFQTFSRQQLALNARQNQATDTPKSRPDRSN